MDTEKYKSIIEAILFAAGRIVTEEELIMSLEISKEQIQDIIKSMKEDYKKRGIEIIKIENGYQLCTKKEYYDYIYPILDKRTKPNLSTAALETLAIIAYNPKITRSQIEEIRGVNSDGAVYKLLEYGYKAEHDSFYVIFYIGEKLYLIELVKFQIRLFNNEEDYYFDDVESMFKKITELRDKEAV